MKNDPLQLALELGAAWERLSKSTAALLGALQSAGKLEWKPLYPQIWETSSDAAAIYHLLRRIAPDQIPPLHVRQDAEMRARK